MSQIGTGAAPFFVPALKRKQSRARRRPEEGAAVSCRAPPRAGRLASAGAAGGLLAAAVMFGVLAAGVCRMLGSLRGMALRGLGVMRPRFMAAFVVMLCRFAMMPGSRVVMFGCLAVMFG